MLTKQNVTINEEDFSLDTFERLVYRKSYDSAAPMLIKILQNIEQKTFDLIPDNANDDEKANLKSELLTRFAAAITSMFADPKFNLNESLLLDLLIYKRYIVSLFGTTAFSNMNHIIGLVGQVAGNGQVTFQGYSSFFKLMLTSSIYSPPELVLQTLNSAPEGFKLPYWLSLLDTEAVLNPDADQLRNQLLLEGETLQNELVPYEFVIRIINIWMFVSYFTTPKKHDVKKHLNSMLLKWMETQGVKQPVLPPRKSGKTKPKLLVLSEMFTSVHAMYRCYSPSISQLRSKFHTVLVAATGSYDETSKSIFDEVIDFVQTDPIKKTVGKIIRAHADIIYYPSIGMESWTTMTCQLRLAPIQMMTMGHPATSNSEFMDYALIEEFSLGDSQCFSETVVVKNEGAKFSPYDDQELPTPVIREKPETIKIAIPATMYKLNSDFLGVCKNIEKRVKRPIEFHFFPNRLGIMLDFATQMIWKWLPNSTVYPSMSYQDYMKYLGACDIHFSTFPFGLANGIVDSSLVALPIVALDGPEVHSHSDVGFQQRLGLPGWLSANTQEEFEEAAVRLIGDDELRVSISKDLVDADPYKIFFANKHADTDYFANLADWIYRNHESIQTDGRKTWTEEDFIDGNDIKPTPIDQVS
jgi:hypothetical protein